MGSGERMSTEHLTRWFNETESQVRLAERPNPTPPCLAIPLPHPSPFCLPSLADSCQTYPLLGYGLPYLVWLVLGLIGLLVLPCPGDSIVLVLSGLVLAVPSLGLACVFPLGGLGLSARQRLQCLSKCNANALWRFGTQCCVQESCQVMPIKDKVELWFLVADSWRMLLVLASNSASQQTRRNQMNKTIKQLKDEGYTGQDSGLDYCLFDYGLAWKEDGNDFRFIYSTGRKNAEGAELFDWGCIAKDTDCAKEFNWIGDWQPMLSTLGLTTFEEWNGDDLPRKIADLVSYYGVENIFGSTYSECFAIRDPQNIIVYELPEHWACAIINGDDSGLDADDKQALADFMEKEGNPNIVDCTGEGYFSHNNDAGTLACNVLEYTALCK